MKLCSILFFLSLVVLGKAQNSDLIIYGSDTIKFSLFLDGREYKVDGASKIKITDIPEAALVNVSVMLQTAQPKAGMERLEFKGSYECQYQLLVPKKGNKLELKELAKNEKDKKFKAADLGENFVVYRFNKYAAPTERVRGSIEAASSMKMTRKKEVTPSLTIEEDGKRMEKTSSRKQTVKEQGASTVIHQERATQSYGDERERTILKPRKEDCEGAWSKKERTAAFDELMAEIEEAGKLYVSKKTAIDYCMPAEDAKEILTLFESEATRIEIAKFIYPSLVDVENFEILGEVFDSPSSWEAVKLYVEIKYE